MQDSTVEVVVPLLGRVDADPGLKFDHFAVVSARPYRHALRPALAHALDIDDFGAIQTQRCRALAVQKLQWHHTHPDQIRSMNSFVTLDDDRLDPQQLGALGRPVPGGAGAVLRAANDHQGRIGRPVTHRGVEDADLFAAGDVCRPSALGAGRKLVPEANVGKRSSHHHFVVAAPGPIRIEVLPFHSQAAEVLARGAVQRDGARR